MRNLILSIFFLFLFGTNCFPQRKIPNLPIEDGWLGILPVHSNRAEVEKRLGVLKEMKGGYFSYEDGDVVINFVFSGEPCAKRDSSEVLNVPQDTVLEFLVALKKPILTSELNWNRKKYYQLSKIESPEFPGYFNSEDFIHVLVTKSRNNREEANVLFYGWSKKHLHLKCK